MKEKQDNVIQFKSRRTGVIAKVVILVFVIGLVLLFTSFHIESIEVTGNKHYSKEQIKDFVLSNGYIDNTILLMLKNKIHSPKDIPFIAKLDIEYVNPHKINVTVYEKAMAGCVEYMNQYVYFDQDGYVLEISLTKLTDTPCITGMNFSSMELHEKLPIEDKKRFKLILKLTQLIGKYNLTIDSIRFTSEDEVVLYYEDVRVELGDGSKIDEQLVDLKQMLEGLKGKKGTLNLKDFDPADKKASFKLDMGTSSKNDKKEEDDQNTTENDTQSTSESTESSSVVE
ncbi:MAG: FtsQ-type POTRA domain-containing protein [Clostridiales bacterium]|nr:FtsQ-type POTRA domain-containing protein [Clostridiales bacterium]